MVEFDHVSKAYPDGTRAVQDLTLKVEAGEFVVLIGPSGCGKTTSLRMVNRMVEPTGGSIRVEGRDVSNYNPVELRRSIGYVVQHIGLFPHMTIAQNIEVVPTLLRWDAKRRQTRTDELLSLVGMEPDRYRDRYPGELSGGQQQRIGVLRALAADPKIVLMDEPFSALDPITREQLQTEFKRLQTELHKTIVFVTHDMDEAIRLGDRLAILRQGRLLQFDTPGSILRDPADAFVADFIGRHRRPDVEAPHSVREIMDTRPVTMDKDKSVEEAFAVMRSRQVDTLLVTDREGRLYGMVTAWHIANRRQFAKALHEVCETDVATVGPDEDASAAFERLDRERTHYLAVVEDGRLVGLVTRRSMVRALAAVVWGDDA